MLKRLVLSAAALACAAIAAPTLAEPVTLAVPYGDLDLTTQDGRAILDIRLARAARMVCGDVSATRDLLAKRAHRACVAEARANTRDQVELALNAANARRVAVLADKIGLLARF
jgi:UrcA family protein